MNSIGCVQNVVQGKLQFLKKNTGPLQFWYSEEGTGPQAAYALLAVPNVTAHPSTASISITALLYNGPLLCGVNVPVRLA